jgi:hypothetical protein
LTAPQFDTPDDLLFTAQYAIDRYALNGRGRLKPNDRQTLAKAIVTASCSGALASSCASSA